MKVKWTIHQKMCSGYRVLLSSPSLLAIDFTVFVRFIPFYFHQGKLGCQDLLTQNKPLSLSWLLPSRAGCKMLPGSVWQGRKLLAFTHPSQSPCLSPLRASSISSWPACRGQSQKPVPEVIRVPLLHWHPMSCNCVLQFIQFHWKASLSCVLAENQETSRAGIDKRHECMHGSRQLWHSHSNAIWVSPFTFLQWLYLVTLWERSRISRDTLKATRT